MARTAQPARAPSEWPPDLARPVVVVDLETTGGSPIHDRIIEIAALRLSGGRVRDRWHTLIDPGVAIPPFVIGLTGITSGLVARAPRFREVADALQAFVGDAVLAAHNAPFDIRFLQAEFARIQQAFHPTATLCTLKLARRLLPGLPSHSLESLTRALGLRSRRLHRALPDAMAAAEVLLRLMGQAIDEGVTDWRGLLQLAERPVRRGRAGAGDRWGVGDLPRGPGVYLLKDRDENVLYVGKSVHVRNRVATHLRGRIEGQPRLRRQLRHVASVQAIPTGTELEALLLESQLIKRYLPVGNALQREQPHYPYIRIDAASAFPRISLTRLPRDDGAEYIGPFPGARTVGHVVEYVRAVCGIRSCERPELPDGRACLLFDLKRCLGPCVGAVNAVEYRAAVNRALALLKGDWEEIAGGLEARMAALAEREEFERAAELRDAVDGLRRLIAHQAHSVDLAGVHAVVISDRFPSACADDPEHAPSKRTERPAVMAQLVCIRGGRLVLQQRLTWPADRARLARWIRPAYQGQDSVHPTPEVAQERMLVSAWLRRERKRPGATVIDVDPTNLPAALAAIRADLDRRAGERVQAPSSETIQRTISLSSSLSGLGDRR